MASKPPSFAAPEGDYAGDISCKKAWELLGSNPGAVLVDVRTQVEWQLIGKPDLRSLDKEPVYLQWVTMQGMNENFVAELKAELEQRDVPDEAPVIFMCQSGGRSRVAAVQCAELGYKQCFNLAEGFEGELDEQQHRNSVNGWKAAGLPWVQS